MRHVRSIILTLQNTPLSLHTRPTQPPNKIRDLITKRIPHLPLNQIHQKSFSNPCPVPLGIKTILRSPPERPGMKSKLCITSHHLATLFEEFPLFDRLWLPALLYPSWSIFRIGTTSGLTTRRAISDPTETYPHICMHMSMLACPTVPLPNLCHFGAYFLQRAANSLLFSPLPWILLLIVLQWSLRRTVPPGLF